MIPTHRRVEYASGYLELGLVASAAEELGAIDPRDDDESDVLRVRADYYMQIRSWESLIKVSAALARRLPDEESGWISWAYALRELERVAEARDVLLEAEFRHGRTCGVLHYNLACYACLLGDSAEALRRLQRAQRISPEWKEAALGDSDLEPLRAQIAAL